MLRLVVLELRETVPIMESSHTELSHMRGPFSNNICGMIGYSNQDIPHMPIKDKLIASSQQKYGGRVWFNREGNVRIGGPPLLFSAWNNALGVAELVCDFIGAGL